MTTASVAVGQVPVSLPTNAMIDSVGQTTVVNITIGNVTNVEGIALSFIYNEAIADVMTAGNVVRGPLTQNCDSSVINVSDPGRLTITAACFATPISGSGVLFSITFTGIANGSTALEFSTFSVGGEDLIPNGCLLNEGTPQCAPMNGNLTVGPVVGPTATATNTVPTATATNTPLNTATRTNTVAAATATSTFTLSATPTVTDTPTTGPSPTSSNTATITSTPTITNTPVNTGTATDTPLPSATATITSTGTVTGTATVTRTRPGIPVVPSPASPAGAAMIAALGVALLWAMRRLYRPQ